MVSARSLSLANPGRRPLSDRLLPRQPEVMLCVLVKVLGFDRITGRCSGACERQVAFVAPFGIGKGIGFARPQCRHLRAAGR